MSVEENKAIVRHYIDVVNKKNLAAMDEIFDANYVGHVAGFEDVKGPEELKQGFATVFSALPDLHDTIEDMVAEGDKVVTRLTFTGTHKGEVMGIAPTGKQVKSTGIAIFRIVGGKVVEEWVERDTLGMMQQLGVIPSG